MSHLTGFNKGLQTAWPGNCDEKFREIVFERKKPSACSPNTGFFTNFFTSFLFSRLFLNIFAFLLSHNLFAPPICIFSNRISKVCCPKDFHSKQPPHCITAPKTGHTSTCRSSLPLLTQYSHKSCRRFLER